MQKVLGPEHRDTAFMLNNLALLLHSQGDLAGARPLHERALATFQKVLGPEHPRRSICSMAEWQQALELGMTHDEIAKLPAIARSRMPCQQCASLDSVAAETPF
jgi:Tetratricopeptide repeat